MNIFEKPKLLAGLAIVALLVFLAASNPDSKDFREWYVEEHGIGAALISIAVKREDKVFFSTYSIGGQGLIGKRTLAYGIAGTFFKAGD